MASKSVDGVKLHPGSSEHGVVAYWDGGVRRVSAAGSLIAVSPTTNTRASIGMVWYTKEEVLNGQCCRESFAKLGTLLYLNELGEVLLWLSAGWVRWHAYTVGWVCMGGWWAGGCGLARLLL